MKTVAGALSMNQLRIAAFRRGPSMVLIHFAGATRKSSNVRVAENVHIDKVEQAASTSSSPLTDTFGRFHSYLRISLTEKCNMRCIYCMPADGVNLTPRDQLLTFEERKRVIDIFAHLGITKVRFTGGEPTLSKDLLPLIAACRNYDTINSIGMTTNAILLSQTQIQNLVAAGLTSINISLDSLNAAKFAKMSRRDGKGMMKVLGAIYASVRAGLKVKVNCVLMRGINDDELTKFIDLTKDTNVDVRFIELMPFDGNEWSPSKFMSYKEAIERCAAQGYVLQKDVMVDSHDTTKWYRMSSLNAENGTASDNKYTGRVGFISSMSAQFCGGCNRLRITADGKLKVCLFGEEGFSFRDAFRGSLTSHDRMQSSSSSGSSSSSCSSGNGSAGCHNSIASGSSLPSLYSNQISMPPLTNEEIIQQIAASVRGKKKALGGHKNAEEISKDTNRPMILIGG